MPRIAIGLATILAVLAIGGSTIGRESTSGSLAIGTATDRFPSDTFEDWVTFAHFVAIASVVGEDEIPPPSDVITTGEGYIGRTVDVQIDAEDILWLGENNPDWFTGIEDVVTWGWVLEEGVQLPFGTWGSPRIEVGQQYIIPFVLAPGEDGVSVWTALSSAATLPYDGEFITTDGIIGNDPSPILSEMEGQNALALVGELQLAAGLTSLDTKYADLDPDARTQAVLRERGQIKP